MKGLIKNDIYCLVDEEAPIFLFEVFVIITSIILKLSTPGAILGAFLFLSLAYRVMSVDLAIFIDAAPVKKSIFVLEKYILCVGIIVLAALISFIISCFNVGNMLISFAIDGLAKTTMALLIYGLYDIGVTLFVFFVFGKSRIIMINTLIKLMGILLVSLSSIQKISDDYISFAKNSNINVAIFTDVSWSVLGYTLIGATVIYIISFYISQKIYERREVL